MKLTSKNFSTQFPKLLAVGNIHVNILSGRYAGTVTGVNRISSRTYSWTDYSEDVWKPNWPEGKVNYTPIQKNSILQCSVGIAQSVGKKVHLTLNTDILDVKSGPFEPIVVDAALNPPPELFDKFNRKLEVGHFVALIHNHSISAAMIESIDWKGHATIKTVDGHSSVSKTLNKNCIIIDKNIENAALLYKLSK